MIIARDDDAESSVGTSAVQKRMYILTYVYKY
jgi:hypothetical protein